MEAAAPRRRIIVRRRMSGGGGFSSGVSTRSESLRAAETEAEPDEVDEAIEPAEMPLRIRRGMLPPPPMAAAPSPAAPADAERDNPRQRLNQVALAGSASYAKEYRLSLLHRLLMRNVPLDQIAQQLQVSISTVEKDRAELKRRLREAAKELNIDEMVGGQSAVYDEIAGMALRLASGGSGENSVPTAMRLAAMRTALAANADRTRFLTNAGVFDVLRFRRAEDGTNLSDVQLLMQRTMELMESLDNVEPNSPSAPPAGGFSPMSFDDADASGGLSEIQEI